MSLPFSPVRDSDPGCGDGRVSHYAAVLGHPIDHSLSPLLHNAAIAACQMTGWCYGRHDVEAAGLADAIDRGMADGRVRGFSCTMPLKEELVALAHARGWAIDETARLTGVANTWVAPGAGDDAGTARILNTDVAGIVGAIAETGVRPDAVDIVGTGATARSAVVAAIRLGAGSIRIHGRNAEKARSVAALVRQLGGDAQTAGIDAVLPGRADLLISTLPVGVITEDTWTWPAVLGETGAQGRPAQNTPENGAYVLDVAYAPGGFNLGAAYTQRGGHAVDGTRMLLHQAVDQFLEFALAAGLARPQASSVLAAMAAALQAARA